jgi:hypothetical protein
MCKPWKDERGKNGGKAGYGPRRQEAQLQEGVPRAFTVQAELENEELLADIEATAYQDSLHDGEENIDMDFYPEEDYDDE